MAKILDAFTVARSSDGYLLQFVDDEGTTAEFVVSYDLLDQMSEEIEQRLNEDEEEALSPDDEEDDIARENEDLEE